MDTPLDTLRALFAPLPPGGGDPDVLLPEPHRTRLLQTVASTLAYLQPELRHAERIPRTGGALLVGNHGLMGIDSAALYPLLHREVGRVPRGLAERVLIHRPVIGTALQRCGAVEGTQDNGVRLLQAGELVLVYPGGAPESFKGPENHYRLRWHDRFGFIRLALRAQVPIVPVMGAGIDHAYRYLFRDRWLTRHLVGQGRDRYDFPVSLGLGLLPLPTRFVFHVGEPIVPPQGPGLAEDPRVVADFHAHVWHTSQALLDAAMTEWRRDRLSRRQGR